MFQMLGEVVERFSLRLARGMFGYNAGKRNAGFRLFSSLSLRCNTEVQNTNKNGHKVSVGKEKRCKLRRT